MTRQINQPVELADTQSNQSVLVTPLRELSVATKVRLFGDSFADGVGVGEDAGTFPATPTVTGTATGSSTGGAFVFSTGATGGASGDMTSLLTGSFVTGSVMIFQGGILLPSASLTSFRVVSRKASVDTVVDSSAFNVVVGSGPVNGLFQRYEILYQGNAAIFTVGGFAAHRMTANTSSPRTTTLSLPLAFTWTSTAGPTATVRFGCFTAAEGLFFEANYSISNITGQVRGITLSRSGAAESHHQIADVTGLTSAESYGAYQLNWDDGGTPGWRRGRGGSKGFQQTFATMTQDMKDAGRNPVHFYTVIPVLTTATDTLQSLTGTKAGATVAATTTPAVVTAAKTFRITRLSATYIATIAGGYGMVRLRFNTAGVVAIGSPVAVALAVGSSAPATANSTGSLDATVDDGWEFAAGTGIGVSVQGFADVTATAVGYVMVSVTGYEY